MSALLTTVAAEIPVCTSAGCAAVGWLVRKVYDGIAEAQRALKLEIAEAQRAIKLENERRDTDLARQSQALAILVAAQEPLDERLGALEKRRDSLTEATAVLGAELEAHQRWHVQPAYHPAHH